MVGESDRVWSLVDGCESCKNNHAFGYPSIDSAFVVRRMAAAHDGEIRRAEKRARRETAIQGLRAVVIDHRSVGRMDRRLLTVVDCVAIVQLAAVQSSQWNDASVHCDVTGMMSLSPRRRMRDDRLIAASISQLSLDGQRSTMCNAFRVSAYARCRRIDRRDGSGREFGQTINYYF